MRDLTSKVAVITGGAGGIGFAMAERFGREGVRLVIADIQADAVEAAAERLRGLGYEALGVRCDVSDAAEVEALAEATLSRFGKVHILANNAGVSITGPIWQLSLDDWRWVHDVNVRGVIHGIKAFVPRLLEQGEGGHILNTASTAAFSGIGEHAPYCASKAAVVSISQSLYSELAAAVSGVGVSVICPGMVSTDIHRSWRNRPAGDQAWSDREWADAQRREETDRFQGAGVSPEVIAEAALHGVLEDRLYVFHGDWVPSFLEGVLGPIVTAQNPRVWTWGPDLRPAAPPKVDLPAQEEASLPTPKPLAFVSLPDRIRAVAHARPLHRALIQEDRVVTFAALDSRIDRIAAALQAGGVRPQDVVAICSANSIAYVEVFCGALRAGVAVAPLPPSAHPESLARMIADCGAKALFVDAASAEHLAPARAQVNARVVTLDGSGGEDDLEAVLARAAARALEPVAIAPEWTFNIIYSSGTTGDPKGIVQPHVMRTPWEPVGAPFGYGADATVLVSTGLYSNTTLSSLFPALGGGGSVLLMAKFDAHRFLELSAKHRVTHAMLVPVQYQRILAQPDFDAFDLSAYRMKFCTSAPLSTTLKRDILRRWPGGLTEYYGMTEGGGGTALHAHDHPDKLHTVGRPWPHTEIKLIGEDGQEVATGEVGEIVGASGLMMTGYHNRPDETSDATWRDPHGRRFIRHGDMGRFDEDGFLILMDRKKDMIISGGFNIYPSDLEDALREHPAVVEAAVVGSPSEDWGETPVGFVTLAPGASATPEEIKAAANARLGRTQRLSAVEALEHLPRSPIGKILKRELRERCRSVPFAHSGQPTQLGS